MTRHNATRPSGGILLAAVLSLLAGALAQADTVYMKNGTKLYGAVRQEGNQMVLETAGRRVFLRADEIDRVEENDKRGEFDHDRAMKRAKEIDQRLFEKTGLTAAQRAEVQALLGPLQSTNPSVYADACNRLIAMNKRMDIVRYLEYRLPSLSPRLQPGVLDVLAALNPKRAKVHLREHATDAASVTRAVSLTLLGKLGDTESVELVTRGLLDHDPGVRNAAAHALARLKAKEATPVLIYLWQATADRREENACRGALRTLWSAEDNIVDFESPEEWIDYWDARKGTVEKPLEYAALTPLVSPHEEFENE